MTPEERADKAVHACQHEAQEIAVCKGCIAAAIREAVREEREARTTKVCEAPITLEVHHVPSAE